MDCCEILGIKCDCQAEVHEIKPFFLQKSFLFECNLFLDKLSQEKEGYQAGKLVQNFFCRCECLASTLFAALALFFCRQELAKCMHAPPLTRTHTHTRTPVHTHTRTLTLSRSTRDPDESCNKSRSNFELGFFAQKLMISSSSPSSHCWQLHRKKLFM